MGATLSSDPGKAPTRQDWMLLAISLVFVALGFIILPSQPEVGIVTLAFFGSCLAVAGWIIGRKLRASRFRADAVTVAGGVPIRASKVVPILLGVWLLALGAILYMFGAPYGPVMPWLAGAVALGGATPLVMLAMGRYDKFLQFDPEGLTVGEQGWRMTVPWDAISAVDETEYSSNPLLQVGIDTDAGLLVQPPEANEKAQKWIGRNLGYFGAPVAIMTTHYGIALPVLAAAIRTYVRDPRARAGLASEAARLAPPEKAAGPSETI